ncbi:hypothetical protein ACSNOK_10010 [Streptomyces sp. URMC 126]|uniref:hypothetical protein n=1 Tax=Streptomyces sp. URMC 126 TaxID=3423401 RepID=UPI003F1A4FBA
MSNTSPPPTAPRSTAAVPPLPSRLRKRILSVPVATALGVACAGYALKAEAHRGDRSVPCKPMRAPVSTSEYLAAWAGLALGVTAVAVCLMAAFSMNRSRGVGLASTKPGLLASASAWLNLVAIPFESLALLLAHRPAGVWPGGDCG